MKIRLSIHSVHFTIHFIFKGNIQSSIHSRSFYPFVDFFIHKFKSVSTPFFASIDWWFLQSILFYFKLSNQSYFRPKIPCKTPTSINANAEILFPVACIKFKIQTFNLCTMCLYFCVFSLLDKIERETNTDSLQVCPLQFIHGNYFWFIKLHHNPRSLFFLILVKYSKFCKQFFLCVCLWIYENRLLNYIYIYIFYIRRNMKFYFPSWIYGVCVSLE